MCPRAKSFFLLAFLFLCNYSDANDLTIFTCESYVPATWAIAKPMREAGISIVTAQDHLFKLGIEDKKILLYLRSLIEDIYKDPNATSIYIENGKALEDCVKQASEF